MFLLCNDKLLYVDLLPNALRTNRSIVCDHHRYVSVHILKRGVQYNMRYTLDKRASNSVCVLMHATTTTAHTTGRHKDGPLSAALWLCVSVCLCVCTRHTRNLHVSLYCNSRAYYYYYEHYYNSIAYILLSI